MDILEKFTSRLRDLLAQSYALARELDSPAINPEHLLLALIQQKGGVGGEILRRGHLDADEIRQMLKLADELAVGQGATPASAVGQPKLSPDAKRAIEKAVLTANNHEHKYVGTEHLLAGLLEIGSPAIEAVLMGQDIDAAELRRQVDDVLKSTSKFPEITERFDNGQAAKSGAKHKGRVATDEAKSEARRKAAGGKAKTPALEFFAIELTDPKAQENIDPVIGRDQEIQRLIQILCRRTKNNPVLLGEAGVGKTAIVEGLAKRILAGDVPAVLLGKRLFSLDLGLIIAGTIYRGEFESRVKQIIEEVKNHPEILLFIDEIHNITGAGSTNGSMDAANILKPALARGDLRCIGATTPAEFKKNIESDAALERRFQPILVEPPSPELAIAILQGLRGNYEAYHGVTITDEAIEAAVKLSDRYVTDRCLPDKAIDLMDEAAAGVRVAANETDEHRRLQVIEAELEKIAAKKRRSVASENFIEALELKAQEKKLEAELKQIRRQDKNKVRPVVGRIGRREVAEVVSRATGIPLSDLMKEERDRLLRLEDALKARLVGQDEAVKSVAELVRRAKAGIANPKRPLASFLFLGPSGVGKTELAKVLAETVFQDPEALVRLDMSEFAEGFNLSKLIGAPAGYVGYKERTKLTDIVKRKPHAVVLFDEIEKAHDEVHNLLLQLLEDGQITDATGRTINFKNAIIIMTSNVGATQLMADDIGFSSKREGEVTAADINEARERVTKELEKHFRPEFINRIDKVAVFKPLSLQDLRAIVGLQVGELAGRVGRDYDVRLTLGPKAALAVAKRSWNPLFGARGVRRQIQELVENPLARELLAENFKSGDHVVIDFRDGEVVLNKKKAHARVTG